MNAGPVTPVPETEAPHVRRAALINTGWGSFRPGVAADIIGVAMVLPANLPLRPCFQVKYADGVVDYVAIFDAVGARSDAYEIVVAK